MPRAKPSDRLRSRLARLPRGEQAALARWSQRRPGGSKIGTTRLNQFIQRSDEKRRGLYIDDLDDIADFLNVSIGELLGDTKHAELSAQETRMLHAFKALPEPYQQSVIAIIELASIAPKINPSLQLRATYVEGIRSSQASSTPHSGDRTHAPHQSSAVLIDPSAELERVRAAIQGALVALEEALATQGGTTNAAAPVPAGKDPSPHRSVPSPRPK